MRDYERLRKVLDKFLNGGPMGGPPCVACFGDVNCCGRPELRAVLEETPETSEMERLFQWLTEQAVITYCTGHRQAPHIYSEVADYIRTEFGYGEEQDGQRE